MGTFQRWVSYRRPGAHLNQIGLEEIVRSGLTCFFNSFLFTTQNQRRRVFAKFAFEWTRAVLFSEMYTGPWQCFCFLVAFGREKPLWFWLYISLLHNQNDKFLLWLCLFLLLINYWSDKRTITLFANNSPFSRESRLNLWQLIYLHCPFRSPASAN